MNSCCAGLRATGGLPGGTGSLSARASDRREYGASRCTLLGGFSLIELVAVMAIMGIVFLIAQPRLTGFVSRDRVRRSATRLRMDLRWAQNEAIRRRTKTAVAFDRNHDFYAMWYYDTSAATPDWELLHIGHDAESCTRACTDADKAVALGADPDYRVAIKGTTLAQDDIEFDPYGASDSGGTIVLGIGTLRINVEVDNGTGKTTITDLAEKTEVLNIDQATPPTDAQVQATKP